MALNEKEIIKVKFKKTSDRLRFWNGPVGLSPKEILTLGALIDAKGDLCGTLNRREAAASIGMSKEVINTYIKRLKTKKAILYVNGVYKLSKIFEERPRVEVVMHVG
jgi:hypothetical protein